MSSLTAKKQHVSTQSESESETSTKRSTERFNSKEFLFNMLTESSNTMTMNSFQQEQDESLTQEFSRKLKISRILRLKIKVIFTQDDLSTTI